MMHKLSFYVKYNTYKNNLKTPLKLLIICVKNILLKLDLIFNKYIYFCIIIILMIYILIINRMMYILHV